jgi:Flp pilus assembly protein TadG
VAIVRWLRKTRLLSRDRSRGQSLVLLAFLLPVLLIFVAFVVDGAHAFVDRNTGFPQTA